MADPSAMRPVHDARHPELVGCDGMITPDQLIRGGPALVKLVQHSAQRLTKAPNQRELLVVAPQVGHALRAGVASLTHGDRSGTFLGLLALAKRLSAEVCTCSDLQRERRRSGVTPAPSWCPSCHARAALGLPNPRYAP